MFGWENLGQKSVEEAHKAVIEGIEKLKPLLDFVEDQGAGLFRNRSTCHGRRNRRGRLAWLPLRLGTRIEEVPFVFSERVAGASKMSVGITLEGIRVTLALRRHRRRVGGGTGLPAAL